MNNHIIKLPFFGLSGVLQIEEKDNAKTRTVKQAKTIKPSFELSIKIIHSNERKVRLTAGFFFVGVKICACLNGS